MRHKTSTAHSADAAPCRHQLGFFPKDSEENTKVSLAQSKASLKSSSAKRIAAKMLKWVVWQLIDEEPSSTLDTPSRDHFSFSGSQKTQTAWRSSPLSERTIGSCSACLSGLPEESKSERLKGTAARSVSFCEAPAPAADNSLVISELSGPAVKATTPDPNCCSTAWGTETFPDRPVRSLNASDVLDGFSTATVISFPSEPVTEDTTVPSPSPTFDKNCFAKVCSCCRRATAATLDTSRSFDLFTQSSSSRSRGGDNTVEVLVEDMVVCVTIVRVLV
mmetsp:Transcript_18376/g.43096  ORF Transcript_18376/g.43096 Transcript_18376/m.43096 type:complete len:277 (+) Transcript_18376:2400-3230(+)